MTCYACLFEAKSIQDYILRSGRLRHIVGASELIDSLTGKLLDDVLEALKSVEDGEVRLSRRAGGAVYPNASRPTPNPTTGPADLVDARLLPL